MDTPHRFRTKRQFWSSSGLAVVTRSSAEHEVIGGRVKRQLKQVQTRGLTTDYNRRLKALCKSAATQACCCGAYKQYYEGLLQSGMRPEMARLVVTRKLAAVVLAVWKSGESFAAESIMSQAA